MSTRKLDWRKLPVQRLVSLHPLMLAPEGYTKVLKLGRREGLEEGFYELTFDKEYIKLFLREKVTKSLCLTNKEAVKLVTECLTGTAK